MYQHHQSSLFDEVLSIPIEAFAFVVRGVDSLPQSSFILNPRRLRGSDFLMRWSQGVWSEERVRQAINIQSDFYALPYGPSGTAPNEDVRAFELYFERLEAAGLGKVKRPDLLLFRKSDQPMVDALVEEIGGVGELPFTQEDALAGLIKRALIAVECENSLWIAQKMPDYNTPLTPQKRLGGRVGLKKQSVSPTIILKQEDRPPLLEWQERHQKAIHIWHVFYDMAFGISFNQTNTLINEGLIEPTAQTFQAPGGATSTKIIYKIYRHYAYKLGVSQEEPQLLARSITDKNGHILPYVIFDGGELSLDNEVLNLLSSLAD